LKLGRFIIVAFSGPAFLGAAHAQGGRESASPTTFFLEQAASPVAKAAIATTAAIRKMDQQIVRASWYGCGERLNQRTSTGEIFRPMGHTAAHRTLPLGTVLRVSSLETGLSTIVRVNDRGPAASTGRALDLSRGAAVALGIAGRGEGRVAIEVMH
jgi:rare lipoprotein A (peptidoglycan hydrolase)